MRRDLIAGGLLLLVSILSYGVSYYLFQQLHGFYAVFAHYGIPPSVYSKHPEAAATIFAFRFGILTSLVSGTVGLMLGIWYCIRNYKQE